MTPKLPAIKPRQIIRFLEQHGFILDQRLAAITFTTIQHHAVVRWSHSTIAIFPQAL